MTLFGYKELKILGTLEVSMYFLIDAIEPRNKTMNALSVSKKQTAVPVAMYSVTIAARGLSYCLHTFNS